MLTEINLKHKRILKEKILYPIHYPEKKLEKAQKLNIEIWDEKTLQEILK